MDKFTASNGLVLVPHQDGSVRWEAGWSPAKVSAALREFFAHERDVELGRWRWPEKPEFLVFPSALYCTPCDPNAVTVVNEANGQSHAFRRGDESFLYGYFSKAGAAYFAAHPEPKPWHDAKPGEVWVVSAYGEPIAMTVFESDFGGLRFRQNDRDGTTWAIDTPVITSARRIFPEVSDD